MATRNYTIEQDANTQTIAWSGLLNGDDGVPIEAKDFADYCIQFSGTFGAGGTILWEGSNLSGTGFATLNDAQAAAISKTAAALEQGVEFPRYMRPRVSAGDGTTNLVATMFARRGRI